MLKTKEFTAFVCYINDRMSNNINIIDHAMYNQTAASLMFK